MTATITLPRATVEQALEALCGADQIDTDMRDAITALRAALAQQAESPCACYPGGLCSRQAQCAADVREQQAEPVEPVATVTECEACFTPDVCQLRGTCDHYAASQLRVATQPKRPAEPVEPLGQLAALQTMLRAEVDRLIAAGIQPQRKPLTEEEIDALPWNGSPRQFARAIERAHGIGEGA